MRPVVAVVTAGLIAHLVVAAICAASPEGHVGDFQRYWELTTTQGRPYAEYAVEYPPGALAVLTGLARTTGNRHRFDVSLILLNVLADVLIIAVLVSGWGLDAAAFYLVVSVPILSLLYFRMDLWSSAAATIAVAAWARDRRWSSAGAVCAGAALKLWPLPFGALFLATPGTRTRAPLVVFLLANAIGAGLWLWFGGPAGIVQVLTFRGATGWDIESVIGSVWRVVAPDSLRLEAGAVRAGWTLPALSIGLSLVSTPLAVWAIWTGARTARLGTGWIAGIGAVLSGSALVSPQFLGWLLPGAAIAWTEGDRRSAVLAASLVAVTVTYRVLHTQQMPGLVILRNVMLLAMTLQALRALRSQPREDGAILRFQTDDAPNC